MTDATTSEVRVWDTFVRLFHWSLVLGFIIAWASGDEWDDLHFAVGYFILGLLALRIVWGLVGTRYARFSQFVRGPEAVKTYLRKILTGREPRYIGHNPAGGAMVVALIVTMTATGLSGWMTTLDAFWGLKWVEEMHEILANFMIFLVSLHVAGVLLASLRHRENLVRAMFTGRKRRPTTADIA